MAVVPFTPISVSRISPNRIALPDSVCFRVTRYCNARCGFCLAPPDAGIHPPAASLLHRIDWLIDGAVRTIHFCGGEPTIHPGLADLVLHVKDRGGKSKLTTNGIKLPEALPKALRAAGTQVKVSLHGNQEWHDKMVGRTAFDDTTANIRVLLSAGVPTSIQTTIVSGGEWVVDWVADFCLQAGVRRLSILPFIPRGLGLDRRDEFGLTTVERRRLHDHVTAKRRELNGRLEVRWLDFTARPIHVVEPDGRVVLESATESMDQLICRIPAAP